MRGILKVGISSFIIADSKTLGDGDSRDTDGVVVEVVVADGDSVVPVDVFAAEPEEVFELKELPVLLGTAPPPLEVRVVVPLLETLDPVEGLVVVPELVPASCCCELQVLLYQ